MCEMAAIQGRDAAAGDEGDRELRSAGALGAQYAPRDCADASPGEGNAYAVVADDHDMTHTDANSDVTPPLDVG
jgi:hypothetical protein